MGAGAAKRLSAVRWGVAGNIVVAWVLTLPRCGRRRRAHLRGGARCSAPQAGPIVVSVVLVSSLIAGALAARRRPRVTAAAEV